MFVNLHELTHIASTKNDPGHKIDFWKNFKIILQEAKEIGVYKPINYKKTPVNYSGMNIFNNPYYINDSLQDKLIAEELRLDKMDECLSKQNNPENN